MAIASALRASCGITSGGGGGGVSWQSPNVGDIIPGGGGGNNLGHKSGPTSASNGNRLGNARNRNARRAIKVFATGGMGGVHRGGQLSMDISADLYEFARSPIGVVSSGFKSFLDTRRSLEFLETLGCTVASLAASQSVDGDLYQAAAIRPSHSAYLSSNDGPTQQQQQQQQRGRYNCRINGQQQQQQRLEDVSLGPQSGGHNFPGFFTTKSDAQSPWQCQSVQEAAEILYECLEAPFLGQASSDNQLQQQQHGGLRAMLLACQIPAKFSLDQDDDYRRAMEAIEAIDKRADLAGKEKTPLILDQLNRLTSGKTLEANLQLLRNNARIGAHLAYEYARLECASAAILPPDHLGLDLEKTSSNDKSHTMTATASSYGTASDGSKSTSGQTMIDGSQRQDLMERIRRGNSPIVVGCTMIDMHVSTKIDHYFKSNPSHSGVTFAGRPHLTLGGVGRNLATALQLLGHEPVFVTSLARDKLATLALAELAQCGLTPESRRLRLVRPPSSEQPASTCFALVLMDSLSGQCEYVIANLEANGAITRRELLRTLGAPNGASTDTNINVDTSKQQQQQQLARAPLLVMDANLSPEASEFLLESCHLAGVPIFLEPTDVVCLPKLSSTLKRLPGSSLKFMSPNAIELSEMLRLMTMDTDRENCRKLPAPSNGDDRQTLRSTTESECLSVDQIGELASKLMRSQHLLGLKCLLVTMDKRGVLVAVRVGASSKRSDEARRQDPIGQIRLMEEISDEYKHNNNNNNHDNKSDICQQQMSNSLVVVKHFAAPQVVEAPVSASGAGDSFASGFISGLLKNWTLDECVQRGFKASQLALQDRDTISSKLRELS